jgi:hypothetical protein
LNGPWEPRQIKDLVNGDTVRESGSGPHKVAAIVVDGGQVLAVWGTKPVEPTDRNASMITMSRERADTRTELQPRRCGEVTSSAG